MSTESPSARLRALLMSRDTEYLAEAHSGLSARIVEEAGFRGIWASGLALSALAGVRDNNELSWTQVVESVELMAEAAQVPILLDGDTGYGDFNNLRRLVRKLERAGGAGVCIEDKCFPKTNSFIASERQPLADIDEFCGKIKAGKDSQTDPAFCLVARVEALIAGFGLDEALRRAEAYHAAGADAILIHSKRPDPSEILAFAREWAERSPLVIVPTTYASTPVEVFQRARISVVIWANALIRAAASAMQRVATHLGRSCSLVEIESELASVREIFRLQGADELAAAELRYAPGARPRPRVVVLAATRGDGLLPVTLARPKVMLPIAGRPLLRHLVDMLKGEGLHDIDVVAGYRIDAIDACGVRILANPQHATTGELASLACAESALRNDVIVLYGDVLFRPYILRDVVSACQAEAVAVVDSAPLRADGGNRNDLAYCSASDDRGVYRTDVSLLHVSPADTWRGRVPDGRWIGLVRLRGEALTHTCQLLAEGSAVASLGMPDLLNHLIDRGVQVRVLYIHGHWLDINDLRDLERAQAFDRGVARAGSPV